MTAADGKTEVPFRVMRVDTAVNSCNSGGEEMTVSITITEDCLTAY